MEKKIPGIQYSAPMVQVRETYPLPGGGSQGIDGALGLMTNCLKFKFGFSIHSILMIVPQLLQVYARGRQRQTRGSGKFRLIPILLCCTLGILPPQAPPSGTILLHRALCRDLSF